MVLTVFAGVAEFKRTLIKHRTDEGRQAARRRGVSFGRPPKLRPDQEALAIALVQEGRSISEVARTFNMLRQPSIAASISFSPSKKPYDSTPIPFMRTVIIEFRVLDAMQMQDIIDAVSLPPD